MPEAERVELARDAEWRRLDPRMLLVHPVNEVIRFLPLVIGVFVLGSGASDGPWQYLGVAVPIALGLYRFVITSFRITGGQIELRRGLLSRRVLTAPLDRVRTVELTSSPIHRILQLSKVEIGTGSAGDNRLVLDSLGTEEARRLRHALLHQSRQVADDAVAPDDPPVADEVLLRLDPSWVRFAPLTTSGLVIAVAGLAASSQFLGNAVARWAARTHLDDRVESLPVLVLVPGAVVAFVVVVSVLSIAGYVVANWGFTLTHDRRGRTFHVRRGLFTTRETSIDIDRLRGLEAHEPLGLRLAGGGRLGAVVTGLARKAGGTAPLVPPAPRDVVDAVGTAVLGGDGPLTMPLVPHGPIARRRRYTRALVPAAVLAAGFVTLGLVLDAATGWVVFFGVLPLVAGVLLARDRYAGLGHALTESHLVVRSGSLSGRRDALQRDGIIGWNLDQSFFQRRAGVMTLTATTAAGHQAYSALDIPVDAGVALAAETVPGLLDQFLV